MDYNCYNIAWGSALNSPYQGQITYKIYIPTFKILNVFGLDFCK